MRYLMLLVCMAFIQTGFMQQQFGPDFQNPEDLKVLGVGRIIEKDKTIINNIRLVEVKSFWIVYLKNESLHDITMESVSRIEFKYSKWGPVKVIFRDNKPATLPLD